MTSQRAIALAWLMASAGPQALAQPVHQDAPPTVLLPPPAPPSVPMTRVAIPPPPPAPSPPPQQLRPTIEAGGFLSREDWWRCDGFNPPDRRGDGMASIRNLLVSQEANRAEPGFGQGIAICDAALADPRMLPQWSLRRANIMHARAMHKAQAGDTTGALTDLDEAERLLGSDALGRRSIGANVLLVRSWAMLKSGDSAAAATVAREAMALRPWEPIYRNAAARLHLAATGDWARYLADSRELAAIDPNRLIGVMALASMRAEWEQVIAVYPQIVLTLPRSRGGFQVQGLLTRQVEQMQFRAEMHGLYAYAHAALGRQAEAVRQLAVARSELADMLTPPLPTGRRTEVTREQRTVHAALMAGSGRAEQSLGRYDILVELRGKAVPDQFQAAYVQLMAARPGVDGASLDLVRAMARAAPGNPAELNQLATMMEGVIARSLEDISQIRTGDLFEAMPEPEIASALPAYDGGSDGFFSLDANGYRIHQGVTEGTQTVRFASDKGSLATANEMVLLRTAELARQGGHRGFLLVARRGLIRHMVTVGMWSNGARTPAGQEAEVDVVFVDPANLPPAYRGAEWRIIDPEQVWTALSPIYQRPPPPRRRTAER